MRRIDDSPGVSAENVHDVVAASRLEDLAEAPDSGGLAAERLPVPIELLDGGEVVILAIKPSLWFVPLDALKWITAAVLVVAGSAWLASRVPQLTQPLIIQVAVVTAGLRVCAALLRWATRHYVLTNRRIMRIRGVFHPDIYVCPLLSIQNTCVTEAIHQRQLRLGTIHFGLPDPPAPDTAWSEIARPHDVHADIRRAIERAIDSHAHA